MKRMARFLNDEINPELEKNGKEIKIVLCYTGNFWTEGSDIPLLVTYWLEIRWTNPLQHQSKPA